MIATVAAAALMAVKALGAFVAAFLAYSLLPWLRDLWLTRHIPPYISLPFLGDLPQLAVKGMHTLMEERAAKYGRGKKNAGAFKMFVGSHVWLISADPESGRRLMHRLLNRFPFPQLGKSDALAGGRDLVSLRGERWRRSRLAWLPTFAPPSLALYAPLMDGCAKKLAARLDSYGQSGEEVDVWRLIGSLTLEVVGTCAFGVRFNTLKQENNGGDNNEDGDGAGEDGDGDDSIDGKRLVAAARTIFANGSLTNGSIYQAFLTMMPAAEPFWKWMAAHFPDRALREVESAREVIRESALALVRRQQRREAAEAEAAEAAANNGEGSDDAGRGNKARDQEAKAPVPSAVSKGVMPGSFLAQMLRPPPSGGRAGAEEVPPPSELDAVANASLFVLAGYETTANTVACCVYALATTPAAQRRVCAEVDAFFASEGRDAPLTPEVVSARFPFCEAAVKEALRLYSPVTAIAREVAAPPGGDPRLHRSDLFAAQASSASSASVSAHASADFMSSAPSVRPGITVAAANWVYQRSEEYWPRALEFLPERWVPEDKGGAASVLGPTTPNAWSPFGGGPRQCVGIKFAMLEAIVALVRLYEKFEFAPGPSQVVPMKMKQGLTLSPDGGVNVVVRRREAFFGGAAPRKEGAAVA